MIDAKSDKTWWDENQKWILNDLKTEALSYYKDAKITDKNIEEFIETKVATNSIVKVTSDIIFLPYLFALLALTCFQCCCCSVPILWKKGCCCFRNCSNYEKVGKIDTKSGDVYISLRKYKKYGCQSKKLLLDPADS